MFLFGIVKHFIWVVSGGYHPEKFWDNWSYDFLKDKWQVEVHPQHSWLLKKLRKDKPKSILEIGCGFGRNIKFLIDNGFEANNITGSDISKKMINLAKKYVNNKNVKFVHADVYKLPFKTNQFDLLISHGVFMHVKKSKIKQSIDEAVRVAHKIIIIEQNYGGNEYTFVHDYRKLLNEKGRITEYVNDNKLGLDLILIEK